MVRVRDVCVQETLHEFSPRHFKQPLPPTQTNHTIDLVTQ